MNVNKVLVLFILILTWSCSNNSKERWDIEVEPLTEDVVLKNVSKSYYNLEVSNAYLKNQFPEFFLNAPDSLLNERRRDEFSHTLNEEVNLIFKEESIQDSLQDIFVRLKHYYPTFELPQVYLFTGELDYQNPVLYYPKTKEMVIGLDWFLGEKAEAYNQMNIPGYFRQQMNPADFKPKVVRSIADHMVNYDIRKRRFIEKMIYEGKLLIVQDALLPKTSDALKIGYTQEQIDWARTNEANVYMYFTEQELFYSDDKKLDARFIDETPFSKFYADNDAETPGKIGAWMGWQICRVYLEKHEEITLQEFLADEDYQAIFTASGYKPTK
ncbi:hypothetical protein GO491_10170 [Flavobacteriaceae bacterium Ap0902]|nr:hypothetical protein [Flavobacteriaceae bacterium Ap0902]